MRQNNKAPIPLVFLLYQIIVFCPNVSAQSKTKDFEVVTQKGILFLSWNNVFYIDSINKHSIDVLYTPDIFIPIKKMDDGTSLINSFRTENLKTAIAIPYFERRNRYKEGAQSFKNDSIGTPCYTEKGYSLLPVCIKYKRWKKYSNILICQAPIVVYSNARRVSFRYITPDIEILEITVLNSANRQNL